MNRFKPAGASQSHRNAIRRARCPPRLLGPVASCLVPKHSPLLRIPPLRANRRSFRQSCLPPGSPVRCFGPRRVVSGSGTRSFGSWDRRQSIRHRVQISRPRHGWTRNPQIPGGFLQHRKDSRIRCGNRVQVCARLRRAGPQDHGTSPIAGRAYRSVTGCLLIFTQN